MAKRSFQGDLDSLKDLIEANALQSGLMKLGRRRPSEAPVTVNVHGVKRELLPRPS